MKLCVIFLFICILGQPAFGQNQAQNDLLAGIPEDSIILEYTQKLDAVQSSFYHSSDSLKNAYQGKLGKMDSLQSGLQNSLDSLTSLQLPTTRIQHVMDSINQLRDKTVATLNEKLQSIKNKTTGRLKALNVPPELTEKVSAITGKIENLTISSSDLSFSSLKLPDNPLGKLEDLSLKSPISKVGNIGELEGVSSKVSEITGDVSGYSQDVKQLAQGNLNEVKELPKTAEAKAVEMSGLSDMQKQTQTLEEYKGMVGHLQDPETIKGEAVEKIQQAAMDHFAGKEQVLQEAMEIMAKYKKRYSSVSDISALPKRLPNEMKGRPLVERLVPGIAVQIQKKGEDLLLDFNPYVGYRFTGRITGGIGWNQRVPYNTKQNHFDPKARIYGPRAFGEYNLWKGFCPRAEVEIMNAFVPLLTNPASVDTGTRQWVWGVFVGMKKDYRFIKGVRGTALIMTRLFDPHHKSPYADIINARFGFEFPMKKKVTPSSGN